MLLQFLKDAFATKANRPSSFYGAMRNLCDLGLGYDSIYASSMIVRYIRKKMLNVNCVKYLVNLDITLMMKIVKKVPRNILQHFSLRLKQLFQLKHVLSEMRWQKDKCIRIDGML